MTLFDGVLGNCGIAMYDREWWKTLTEAEFEQLLVDARAANYGFVNSLSEIRGNPAVANQVWAAHTEVYDWFLMLRANAQSCPEYLTKVPRDIIDIVHRYLRIACRVGPASITGIMGTLHSFDDVPAVVIEFTKSRSYIWYRNGTKYRDNRPVEVHIHSTTMFMIWKSGFKFLLGIMGGEIMMRSEQMSMSRSATDTQAEMIREYWHRYKFPGDPVITNAMLAARH